MKNIITFGAFDLLHYGHMRLLARARNFGDRLIVALASDDLIIAGGKAQPFYPWDLRREMLLHTRYVDCVIVHEGTPDSTGPVKLRSAKIEAVKTNKVDQVIMGADWTNAYDFLRPYCKVNYIARTQGVSTSEIRAKLRQQH